MGETRKMHYVPQCYLRNFAQEKSGVYTIHALPKNGGSIFQANVEDMGAQRDLYRLPGDTQKDRQFIETMITTCMKKGMIIYMGF
jgi:hypothetical protein